jgi:hypothetical protein
MSPGLSLNHDAESLSCRTHESATGESAVQESSAHEPPKGPCTTINLVSACMSETCIFPPNRARMGLRQGNGRRTLMIFVFRGTPAEGGTRDMHRITSAACDMGKKSVNPK